MDKETKRDFGRGEKRAPSVRFYPLEWRRKFDVPNPSTARFAPIAPNLLITAKKSRKSIIKEVRGSRQLSFRLTEAFARSQLRRPRFKFVTERQREALIVAGTLAVLLLIYSWIHLRYLPNERDSVGGNYSLWLPDLLTGYFWHLNNGILTLTWFNPAQCGGVPFYVDPQIPYLSVPQFLTFVIPRVGAVQTSFVLFAAIGLIGAFSLARITFQLSLPASLLTDVLFMFNNFYAARITPAFNPTTRDKDVGFTHATLAIGSETMYRTALIVFATIAAASPVVSLASSFTTLYRFGGGNDGGIPPLIYHNGELYGTAPGNGTTNRGNVFKVNATTGDYHIVYAFQGGADGLAPENGVIYQGGKLYGTTTGGGGKDCVANGQDLGCGTIFSINLATKAETKLYSFPPNAENNFPLPRGITFLSGILYGTSSAGGVNSDGSVFSLNPATGSFTTLYSFQGTGATYPSPRLLYENGLFYGTTEYGGTGCPGFHGCGTAFSINPTTGAESVLYAFAPKANGRLPASNIIYHAGSLIGDTDIGGNKACKRGCGVSYAINVETGVETVLEDFEGGDQHYSGQTLVGGSDYETLPIGSGGNGEIIRVDLKTGKQVVLYTFTGGADGSSPVAPLTYHDGGFYGTTNGGNGTIFKFVP